MNLVRYALLAGGMSLGSASGWAQGGGPDSVVYVLSAASRFEVKTGKAGLFGFAVQGFLAQFPCVKVTEILEPVKHPEH